MSESLIDLASERLGGVCITANDEFFADKENLLRESAPLFIPDKYTERGKWMDGWETRRRREAGYDWCLIRLGAPGVVQSVVVDTAHFVGNFPPECSLEGSAIAGTPGPAELQRAAWFELVPRSPLAGNQLNRFAVQSRERVTHVRLNIFPDGGVARLRVLGEVSPEWPRLLAGAGALDLAALEHGGRVLGWSDMFFGNAGHLLLPGRPLNMGDGWETKRRRGPGHDWVIVALGRRGTLSQIEVDTTHFKGNAPDRFDLEVCDAPGADLEALKQATWKMLIKDYKLQPHTRHLISELPGAGLSTHVRLSIYPDGGVARLRLYGVPHA